MGDSRYLFDDNPARQDLTGLNSVARAIANVAVDERFETLTVGLNSPWGGGKSTALNLIETELRSREDVVVVVIDPWEFVDSGDARGTLIGRVLEGIAVELEEQKRNAETSGKDKVASAVGDVIERLNALRKRVSWSKVAQVVIKSAVTLTPNIGELVEALTPEPKTEPAAKGMRGFREDFGALLAQMNPGSRVVVLIDDLDRSLPDDVLGALEAIKLFLSVNGMAFVIAADDDFIRESLRDALDRNGGNRGRFAERYTEKIVQLPFTLPRLSAADAVAYLAALFVQAAAGKDCAAAVAEKAAKRRVSGEVPYVAPKMVGSFPTDQHIRLANQIVRGMSTSRRETPRQLKRFLNNFHVILDGVHGAGRYLGTYIGLAALSRYWWGEGEVKFFVDGDGDLPSLTSTGLEDYGGGAWAFQDELRVDPEPVPLTFSAPYFGYPFCSTRDTTRAAQFLQSTAPMHSVYRWHIPDPIWFDQDLRVTVQQIGTWDRGGLFERVDDVCSTAYWYQTEPHTPFPALPDAAARVPR